MTASSGACWHPRVSNAYILERAIFYGRSTNGRRDFSLMGKRNRDTHVAATRLELYPTLVAVAPSSCAPPRKVKI